MNNVFLQHNVCVQEPCDIYGIEHLRLGQNIHIGRHSEIMADGGVTIGNQVVISFHCVLWSIDHRYEGDALPYDKARVRRPIVIHDNVWIGRNALICGGVTIGEGAVIGMGSVVTRDVPPLAVVGGNPARVLKFRDARRYASNKEEGRLLWQKVGECAACQSPDFFLVDAESSAAFSGSVGKRIWRRLDNLFRYARWRWFDS